MIVRQPAEWAPHDAVWIGFPSHPELWEENLDPAREEVVAFARAVWADGEGERVVLVAADEAAGATARALAGPAADVLVRPFGDVWLRDTGPILLADGSARDFRFNYWGGKYDLPGDEAIGGLLARSRDLKTIACDWILEGGAIDTDGTGLVVTTEQCVLNPNRNPHLTRADLEALLARDLGLDRVLWLGDGLGNDHTDGHVDNLARFVGPNRLAIPVANGAGDPNAAVYADARARAKAFGVEMVSLPSPGLVERDGEMVPASYMNFYIGNAAVVVPIYGAANDAAAVAAIGALFPGRTAIGVRADHLLTGGGSLHCISQQIPVSLMIAFWVRAMLSGLIVAGVAALARRNPAAGALLASLPLVSVLGMIWLWHDRPDAQNMAAHAEATFWYVIPSLPMFLLIPALLRRGIDFWPSLGAGCVLTVLAYLATVLLAARFGVRL